jgi:hypothetical protein
VRDVKSYLFISQDKIIRNSVTGASKEGQEKMSKKSQKTKTKEKAWKTFSQYIRRRDADHEGFTHCVTCNKRDHWKKLQAGHYVDGRGNAVLFREDLVHPQCFKCNSKRPGCEAGNKIKYTIFMKQKYSLTDEEINDLDNLKFVKKPMKEHDYQEVLEIYENKLLELDLSDDIEKDEPDLENW